MMNVQFKCLWVNACMEYVISLLRDEQQKSDRFIETVKNDTTEPRLNSYSGIMYSYLQDAKKASGTNCPLYNHNVLSQTRRDSKYSGVAILWLTW